MSILKETIENTLERGISYIEIKEIGETISLIKDSKNELEK